MRAEFSALLAALALSVFGNAIWDGIKALAPHGWSRRRVVVGAFRRIVLPGPVVQFRRVAAGLVVSVFLAACANALPPAVLRT
jgi:hypothetical protein